MVIESMTCTMLVVGVFYYYSTRYGLGKDVPVEPGARAVVWANETLQVLKNKLAHSAISALEPGSLSFEGSGGKGRIACSQGKLSMQLEGQSEEVLSHEGENVDLTFEKLSETGLLAKIHVSVPPDGVHDLGVRLEVSYR